MQKVFIFFCIQIFLLAIKQYHWEESNTKKSNTYSKLKIKRKSHEIYWKYDSKFLFFIFYFLSSLFEHFIEMQNIKKVIHLKIPDHHIRNDNTSFGKYLLLILKKLLILDLEAPYSVSKILHKNC